MIGELIGELTVEEDPVSLSMDWTKESDSPGGWKVSEVIDGRLVRVRLSFLCPRSKLARPYSWLESSILERFRSLLGRPTSRLSRGDALPLFGPEEGEKVAFTLSRRGVSERARALLDRIPSDLRGWREAEKGLS